MPECGTHASKATVYKLYRACKRPASGHIARKEGYMTVETLLTHPPVPAAPASLLTERDLCARLRLSPAHVQAMRRKGIGPQFVRIGKAVRYPEPALSEWLAALTAQR